MTIFLRRFYSILCYEFKLARAAGNQLSSTLFFIILYNIAFSFFLNSIIWNSSLLEIVIYWIGVLIIYFMSIERYFSNSFKEGVIEFYLTQPRSIINITFIIKCIVHWVIYGITSGFLAYPIFIWFFESSSSIALTLGLHVLFSTVLLSLLGGLSYNLAIRLPYKSTIISVILFPIYFPILLISINLMELVLNETGNIISSIQLWLAACLFFIVIGCSMTYYSLKYSIDY